MGLEHLTLPSAIVGRSLTPTGLQETGQSASSLPPPPNVYVVKIYDSGHICCFDSDYF